MGNPKYTVRQAVESESHLVIMLFAKNLWHVAFMQPDMAAGAASITNAIKRGHVLVVTCGGEIIGGVAYMVSSFWYTSEKMMFENGFVIGEAHRKTRAGFTLFNAFKDVAKSNGMKIIIGSGTKDPSLAAMMRKRYQQIAAVFAIPPE